MSIGVEVDAQQLGNIRGKTMKLKIFVKCETGVQTHQGSMIVLIMRMLYFNNSFKRKTQRDRD